MFRPLSQFFLILDDFEQKLHFKILIECLKGKKSRAEEGGLLPPADF